jgi:hypothetical protein
VVLRCSLAVVEAFCIAEKGVKNVEVVAKNI